MSAEGYLQNLTLTIANGQTTSGQMDLQGYRQGGMQFAAFTGNGTTFTVSNDGVTFVPLYDSAAALVGQTVVGNRSYPLPDALFGFHYAKIVSNSSEGAARSILVGLRI